MTTPVPADLYEVNRLFCRGCGHLDELKNFPLNGPEDDIDSEHYCPNCGTDEQLINAKEAPPCTDCHQNFATNDDGCCAPCAIKREKVNEGGYPWATF